MEEAKIKKIRPVKAEPLWLSVSESAKFGGVQTKTIRRALKQDLKFKVKGNRYLVDCSSLIAFLHRNTKLKNKLHTLGVGLYVKEWRDTPKEKKESKETTEKK
ncbi:MAG TPA: hypothetical protein PKI61_01565 [bacterium]|nr:hypothetical protein [bacterium]HPT29671.1 hypothetical protein [bacterium]